MGGQLHRRRPPEHPEIHHHRRRRIGHTGTAKSRSGSGTIRAWPRPTIPRRTGLPAHRRQRLGRAPCRAGPKCTISRIGASSTVSRRRWVRPVPVETVGRDGSVPLTCVGQRHRRGHHRPAALTDVHREHRHPCDRLRTATSMSTTPGWAPPGNRWRWPPGTSPPAIGRGSVERGTCRRPDHLQRPTVHPFGPIVNRVDGGPVRDADTVARPTSQCPAPRSSSLMQSAALMMPHAVPDGSGREVQCPRQHRTPLRFGTCRTRGDLRTTAPSKSLSASRRQIVAHGWVPSPGNRCSSWAAPLPSARCRWVSAVPIRPNIACASAPAIAVCDRSSDVVAVAVVGGVDRLAERRRRRARPRRVATAAAPNAPRAEQPVCAHREHVLHRDRYAAVVLQLADDVVEGVDVVALPAKKVDARRRWVRRDPPRHAPHGPVSAPDPCPRHAAR